LSITGSQYCPLLLGCIGAMQLLSLQMLHWMQVKGSTAQELTLAPIHQHQA